MLADQRVYLLHGPPGNGKSSFLQAASILFRMPYCYLEMTGRKLTIEGLRNVLSENTLKIPCLLALEDAESLFAEEKEEKDSSKDDEQEKVKLCVCVPVSNVPVSVSVSISVGLSVSVCVVSFSLFDSLIICVSVSLAIALYSSELIR